MLRRFASLPHYQQQRNASSENANAAHEKFTDATVAKGMIIHASCEELEEAGEMVLVTSVTVSHLINLASQLLKLKDSVYGKLC